MAGYLATEQLERAKQEALGLRSWDLSSLQVCDAELILDGSFAPLSGFLCADDYDAVSSKLKLADGTFWPTPICLQVDEEFAENSAAGEKLALCDPEGVLIGTLEISDIFCRDDKNLLGGQLSGVERPVHYDFRRLRLSPLDIKRRFASLGWTRIIGFQTRRPLHRREVNQTYRAARLAEANLLIHPAVGEMDKDAPYHYARVHCYMHVLKYYPAPTTDLSLTPMYPHSGDIRDILLHALILKNAGCTHFMVNENYLEDVSCDFEALQDKIMNQYQSCLGIEFIRNEKMHYSNLRGGYVPAADLEEADNPSIISDDELRNRLNSGLEVPDWFSFPEVIREVRKTVRSPAEQGFTIFFTGLSGSGKSSIANAVLVKMMEMGGRSITLLDGDIVRKALSSELGFSKEHRDINIRRIGYAASEITKHGGIALCALIAPYAETRQHVRRLIAKFGGFVEVYVSTSLEECERRDRKGLYAKARQGIIKEFTGISDPYEVPENPELDIDTEGLTAEESAQKVILTLEKMGFISLSI